tara:strand:+ start:4501 stop:4734 length:234 start_codon:yes stop_codon:yes gene_type:complete
MAKLTKEELQTLNDLNQEFTKMKVQIGELEVQKSTMLQNVSVLRARFAQEEEKLIKKYGEDSVINLQTGDVSKNKKT